MAARTGGRRNIISGSLYYSDCRDTGARYPVDTLPDHGRAFRARHGVDFPGIGKVCGADTEAFEDCSISEPASRGIYAAHFSNHMYSDDTDRIVSVFAPGVPDY